MAAAAAAGPAGPGGPAPVRNETMAMFHVMLDAAQLKENEVVTIRGDLPVLGSWNHGLPMMRDPNNPNVWTLPVLLVCMPASSRAVCAFACATRSRIAPNTPFGLLWFLFFFSRARVRAVAASRTLAWNSFCVMRACVHALAMLQPGCDMRVAWQAYVCSRCPVPGAHALGCGSTWWFAA